MVILGEEKKQIILETGHLSNSHSYDIHGNDEKIPFNIHDEKDQHNEMQKTEKVAFSNKPRRIRSRIKDKRIRNRNNNDIAMAGSTFAYIGKQLRESHWNSAQLKPDYDIEDLASNSSLGSDMVYDGDINGSINAETNTQQQRDE